MWPDKVGEVNSRKKTKMWSISDLVMALLGTCCLLAVGTSGRLGRDDLDVEEFRDELDGYQRDGFYTAGSSDSEEVRHPMRHRNGRMRMGQLRRGAGGHRPRHSKHGKSRAVKL